jgi:hypothetical protein
MPIFGHSEPDDDPGTVTRVSASPEPLSPGQPVVVPAAADPAPDAAPAGATPVPKRLSRLAALVDRSRPGRQGRNVRKILQIVGMIGIIFGFVLILLGWYGAAHSPYLYEEMPYLISGGILGLAFVVAGGVLVRSAWTLRTIEEDRRNALAIVRSVDRLERILRNLDEARRDPDYVDEEERVR